MKQKRRSSPARAAMKLLCTVLGVILVIMAGATAYFQYLMGRINYVSPEDTSLFSLSEWKEYLGLEKGTGDSSVNAGDVDFSGEPTQIGGRGSHLVNILLIGQDRREGEGRTRSDSMILCTFNKKTRQLTMTSFLRDLYVQIPGYSSNRLNAAYAAGGMPLLDATLEKNFGVHVDGNVEVDFNQFAGIVDLLGGVEMELRQDEAEFINEETGSELSEGVWTLRGDQALAYARIRKLDSDGDFSRTARQRKLMSALLDAYKGAKLTTMLSLVNQVLPMITTDMNGAKILGYALELFPMLSGVEIVSQRVPADGMYTDQTIDGMAVLVADMEATRKFLTQTLAGD